MRILTSITIGLLLVWMGYTALAVIEHLLFGLTLATNVSWMPAAALTAGVARSVHAYLDRKDRTHARD